MAGSNPEDDGVRRASVSRPQAEGGGALPLMLNLAGGGGGAAGIGMGARGAAAAPDSHLNASVKLTDNGTIVYKGWNISEGGLVDPDRARAAAAAVGAPTPAGRPGLGPAAGEGTPAFDTPPAATPAGAAGGAATPEAGGARRYNFRRESVRVAMLGRGASGTVYKMVHVPTLTIVAAKMVPVFDQERRHKLADELKTMYSNLTPFHDVVGTQAQQLRLQAQALRAALEERAEAGAAVAAGDLSAMAQAHMPRGDEEIRTDVSACPYIVSFYDAFSDAAAGTVTFVMEYMDAGSLQDLVDSGGCQSETVLANVSFHILSGLDYLHRNKQIHRDIKPCNILLSHNGDVKLADFGVIKHMDDSQQMSSTWVGTLAYMSPERAKGDAYSYNSDIWSFGLTIIAFATGVFPYEGNRSFFDLLARLNGEPSPELPDSFSEQARDFVRQCLAKDPAERASAETLLRHPFLAGAEERVARERAQRAVRTLSSAAEEERPPDAALSELDDIIRRVQEYRYKAAKRQGITEMPPVRATRIAWLGRQLSIPSHLVAKKFEKTSRKLSAHLASRAKKASEAGAAEAAPAAQGAGSGAVHAAVAHLAAPQVALGAPPARR